MNVEGTIAIAISLLVGAVLLFIRRTRYVGLIVFTLPVCALAYFLWQENSWAVGFEEVKLGATEKEVISVVGKPQRITDGTVWVEPGYKKSDSELVRGCVKEYWYNVFYFPVAYSFCFNKRLELIHKYNWVLW